MRPSIKGPPIPQNSNKKINPKTQARRLKQLDELQDEIDRYKREVELAKLKLKFK